jgi:reductive dehalogenase
MNENNHSRRPSGAIQAQHKAHKKLNRRQFIKIGAMATASGVLIGQAGFSDEKENFLNTIANSPIDHGHKEFPVKITDKCQRMEQKYTIFSRQLWDHEFVSRIESSMDSSSREALEKVKGWTPLDEALNGAAWALDHKFASGSENGQPHSLAYEWDEPTRRKKIKFRDTGDASKKIKKAARYLGASLVGITRYDPLWTYSRLIKENLEEEPGSNGRPNFKTFIPEFPFEPRSVVVIAIEMDYKTMALSPSSLEGASTGLGYSHMCSVGYSVATFIRELGYKAFANGNDVSLSIPYAVAAGLGELGRHGMLITREFGPRVRLVKVFTELDLKPDKPKTFGAWDFCKNCKRCAEACPSQAISVGGPTLEGKTISNNPGVLKWYIDPEKCIQFWRENGSDCANCITACTFNKPSLWNHQLLATMAALPGAPLHTLMAKMDKYFGYGNVDDRRANAAFWDED